MATENVELVSVLVTANAGLRVQADRKKHLIRLFSDDRFYEEAWTPEAVRCLIAALETALAFV